MASCNNICTHGRNGGSATTTTSCVCVCVCVLVPFSESEKIAKQHNGQSFVRLWKYDRCNTTHKKKSSCLWLIRKFWSSVRAPFAAAGLLLLLLFGEGDGRNPPRSAASYWPLSGVHQEPMIILQEANRWNSHPTPPPPLPCDWMIWTEGKKTVWMKCL